MKFLVLWGNPLISHVHSGVIKVFLSLLGCCNGLSCILVDSSRLCIWNPIMNEFSFIPDVPWILETNPNQACPPISETYGFGCSPDFLNYKVIHIVRNHNDDISRVWVYTLGSQSWRELRSVSACFHGKTVEEQLDNMLYWKATKGVGTNQSFLLVSFNTANEAFYEIEPPSLFLGGDKIPLKFFGTHLSLLRGKLCLFSIVEGVYYMWEMKTHGTTHNWFPMFSTISMRPRSFWHLKPVHLTKDSEILLVAVEALDAEMLLYSPSTARARPVDTLDNGDLCYARTFVRSTVSVHSVCNGMQDDGGKDVYMAKLAEQAERYEEMAEFMEKVTNNTETEELTVEERNLLSVAYKNVIGARRASWRIISYIEQKEESHDDEDHVNIIKDYRSKIETELACICHHILKLLDSRLIPSASAGDSKVFYLKMKGDYHRYLAEFKTGPERIEAAESTLSSYKTAQDIAMTELPPTHPIRLGLALNFCVFYYEILNSPDQACTLAKQALVEAFAELDSLGEESYKDSTLIMQFLLNNLALWTSGVQR